MLLGHVTLGGSYIYIWDGNISLCGFWKVSVTAQIAGEVDARMLAAGVDERILPREILDRILAATRIILGEACGIGWNIWREDYQRRQTMRAVEAQPQRLHQQHRRRS